MTFQELLNADMDLATLRALARQGLAWWLDELSSLLPPAWRDRLSTRPRAWLEPGANGGWRLWRNGAVAEGVSATAGGDRVGLLAPAGAVLVREVQAPRLPAADVRRLLSLDLDRLSPLAPDLIHFDIEILDRGEEGGAQKVLLGLLPKAEGARLVAQARAAGAAPVALAARAPGGGDAPHFDFLPQVVESAGENAIGRRRTIGWAVAGALILTNLAVLVGRDMIDVSRLRAAVEGQAPVESAVNRLHRRVETEETRRRAWLDRGRRSDPLRVLDRLSQALPAGAWVQHLEWNGQSLRLIGFTHRDIDMAAAIRGSGAFVNPRVLTAPTAAGSAAFAPFDITADARPEPRR